MDYFAGLDVSVKETSGCIVDDARESWTRALPKFTAEPDRQEQSSFATQWNEFRQARMRSPEPVLHIGGEERAQGFRRYLG